MKKRTWILAVLAVLLVLSSTIGSAVAYFTTYASARGGYVIRLGNWTRIEEHIENNSKTIQIENIPDDDEDIGKHPVFVRVKAFTGSDGSLEYSDSPLWQLKQTDGYWYYQDAVYAGSKTDAFIVDVKLERKLKEGEHLDVIVVYDSVPAVFMPDGSPDLDTAWKTGDITTHEMA